MLFNKYDKIETLKTGKYEWKLRVRAQSIWKVVNRQTQEFRGLNIILIDDSNARIHAFVSSKIADLFDEDLKEGRVFSLSNFHVRVYGGDDNSRAVRFDKQIYFANHTNLKVESENITRIAPYAFDLFDLRDMDKFLTDTRFLVDVVGVITDKNINPLYSKDDKSKLHIRFKISDGGYTMNVTFFNDLAEKLYKDLKDITEECVVIIIASAKVNQHDGATCLNNYPATRFYLNAEHYSVKALKQRFVGNKITEEVLEHEEENVAEMLTVAQIKKLTAEYIERKVRCQITVKKIDVKSNWYDNVCTTCGVEVNIVEGRYKCLICVRNIPYPDKRFRLAAVCNDVTGILPILFPDEDIQRLTGKNAFEIDNDENEVGDDIAFPPTLKAFEKKEYIVTLKIGESNINKSCNIYMATEVNDPGESLGDHSPSKVQVMLTNEKSTCMDLEGTETTLFSPPTGKSSNKIRPRSSTDPVQYEMDENMVLSKLKIIKTEKRGRIHAFVPGAVAEDIEKQVELGVIYLIQNFTVKDYKMEDKFRCIKKEIQIVFGSDTTLKPLQENDVSIERCWFDFYDLEDLKPLGKQNTYLTAKKQSVEEVILANVGATTFYLNYDHYSVTQLRKSLAGPEFKNTNLSKQKYKLPMVYTVKDLNNFDLNDDEGNKEDDWPQLLQSIENKDYTMKIKCIQDNIGEKQNYYVATDIMEGFNLEVLKQEGEERHPHPISYTEPQVSGSSYHLGSVSG
ncbi:DUF223 domain-containing protein [Heracleum sosnowskyi]|uniref:DUF223 domain-containing protein n=1 Tax=Heracleum sosnowskyi TaxID=360622 RepID=A0AAD8JF80_9APIA|nr:DUF223 domain-containing protein [Heracleum sosnowskyi]